MRRGSDPFGGVGAERMAGALGDDGEVSGDDALVEAKRGRGTDRARRLGERRRGRGRQAGGGRDGGARSGGLARLKHSRGAAAEAVARGHVEAVGADDCGGFGRRGRCEAPQGSERRVVLVAAGSRSTALTWLEHERRRDERARHDERLDLQALVGPAEARAHVGSQVVSESDSRRPGCWAGAPAGAHHHGTSMLASTVN